MATDGEAADYENLYPGKKERLNTVFEELVPKITVDYSDTEIQDIQGAVLKLLKGGVDRIRQRGIFNISHIEPCGSMAEKTAVWKFGGIWFPEDRLNKDSPVNVGGIYGESEDNPRKRYIEFDFLAVLDDPNNICVKQGCAECFQLQNLSVNLEKLKMHNERIYNDLKNSLHCPLNADAVFSEELSSIFCCKTGRDTLNRAFDGIKVRKEEDHVCDKCMVDTPSGKLQVDIASMEYYVNSAPKYCSLICHWTSKSKSLSTQSDTHLMKTEAQVNTECLTIDTELQPVTTEPQKKIIKHHPINSDIHLMKTEPQTMKNEPQPLRSEPQTLTLEAQTVNKEPRLLISELQTMTAEAQRINIDPWLFSPVTQTWNTESQMIKTEPGSLCNGSQTIKAEHQTMNTEPQTMNVKSQTMNTELQMIKTEHKTFKPELLSANIDSQKTNFEPQTIQAESKTINTETQIENTEPQAVMADLQTKNIEAQTVKAEPKTMNTEPQTMNTEPQTIKADPQTMNSITQTTEADSQRMNITTQTIKADPQTMNTITQTTEADSQRMNIMTQTIKADPQTMNTITQTTEADSQRNIMTQTMKTEPQTMNTITQTIKVDPQTMNTITQTIKGEPKTMNIITQTIKVDPQTIKAEPKTMNTITQTIKVDPQTMNTITQTIKAEPKIMSSKPHTLKAEPQTMKFEIQSIKRLIVVIDFLLALKIYESGTTGSAVGKPGPSGLGSNSTSSKRQPDCFIVPKECSYCTRKGWRRSGCIAEIESVRKMSNKHRKCYQIMKYLIELINLKIRKQTLLDSVSWYHVKTLLLHHNNSCKDSSEGCAACVLKIFHELQNAYKSKDLKSFHSQVNLLQTNRKHDYERLASGVSKCIPLLCNVSEDDSCEAYLEKFTKHLHEHIRF